MNKGILKKTEAGWFVLYQVMRDEITSGYDSIPLHPDSQTWMDGYNLYDGNNVEFEVRVYPSGARYAKTIPEQVVLDDETTLVKDIFHRRLKPTAVDWLIEQLTPSISLQQKHIDELKEKAKAMEKVQIENIRNYIKWIRL